MKVGVGGGSASDRDAAAVLQDARQVPCGEVPGEEHVKASKGRWTYLESMTIIIDTSYICTLLSAKDPKNKKTPSLCPQPS